MTAARASARIALLAFVALATSCAAPPASVAPTAQAGAASPQDALDRGVAFLVTHQNSNGSWGSFESARPGEIFLGTVASFQAFGDASSALCVLALQEPSRADSAADAAFRRGVEYLLTTPPTARATGDAFYDTWTHTYMIQALAAVHRDERFAEIRPRIAQVIRREIDLLSRRQAADGGWGYYDFGYAFPTPTGNMSTSFNTASALLALRDAQQAGFEVSSHVIHDGLLCLQRLRLPSGAYIYGTYAQYRPGVLYNRVKGSLGRAQPCNLALWLNEKDITLDHLREGLEHLREYHHFIEIGKGRPYPHEAWYFTAGYYFLYGHYYAARVIDQLDPADQSVYRPWLAATMARLQDPDGSWFDFPLYGYHKFYGAAFAVLTLQHCLHPSPQQPTPARPI